MALSGLSAGLQGLTLPLSGQRLGVESISPALLSYSLQRRYNYVDPTNAVNWAHPLNRGRVAWWLTPPGVGGGGSRLLDLAGRNHGTLINMVPSTTSGWQPNGGFSSLAFDGVNDYVLTPFTTALNDFTVSATFFSATSPGLGNFGRIVDKNFATGFWLGSDGATGTGTSWGGGIVNAPFTYVTLSNFAWHRITMTRRGTTKTIFGDGGSVSATATVSGIPLSLEPVRFGQTHDLAAPFNGRIDEVSIWNRALSPMEVALDYQLSRIGYRVPDSPLNWR
jgi:hypothetical protein